jgi:hypothetical protein
VRRFFSFSCLSLDVRPQGSRRNSSSRRRRRISHRRGEGGSAAISYLVEAPFPAHDLLASVRSRLSANGWKPLERDWLNPTIASSHVRGWTYFTDSTATPRRGVHQWSAQWQNDAGDIVGYALRYSSPQQDLSSAPQTPTVKTLEVTATLVAAESAEAMRSAAAQALKASPR